MTYIPQMTVQKIKLISHVTLFLILFKHQHFQNFHKLIAFMAKLVRRHTSNVEILGSTPSESNSFWARPGLKSLSTAGNISA